ncbi:electron carrier/protein disulfide oxidoreductase [Senna tora]|uniref:Electron carrier/protein disulfide oxidoreductase n=1 Tax=Senna tora TaxID=362788 RepID=A0A834WND9_9FABA|nr:electron carrier/protein disulfide oxidoreductase [Senna tora]
MGKELGERHGANSQGVEKQEGENVTLQNEDLDDAVGKSDVAQRIDETKGSPCKSQQENLETTTALVDSCHKVPETESTVMKSEIQNEFVRSFSQDYSSYKVDEIGDSESNIQEENVDKVSKQNGLEDNRNLETTQMNQQEDEFPSEDSDLEPVFDGTEDTVMEAGNFKSSRSLEAHQENQGVVGKALALKNIVRQKSLVAVSTLLRRLSGKWDEGKNVSCSLKRSESKDVSEKAVERDAFSTEGPQQPLAMKGRVILYTRLGCKECKEARLFLHMRRLRYVEINIDVYPSRKLELEKISRSASVPKVFFNEILIGGLSELKASNESGELDEKIDFLIIEAPSFEAPLPPFSAEDDASNTGAPDEMALVVRKMKETIVVKDRFCRMQRFTKSFLGSEAVDFLSEDQYLERKDAIEFARKLVIKLFFRHVLNENLFEDGNHLYRFLDDDPIVASRCHNIPRGITTVKPKPIAEIASRLSFLSNAMFEAYASEDGCHIDYRSLHGSEEFARYLRIVEGLQRVEIWEMSREEKLAFFINLYNMMAIHAILVWGHPSGALDRRKMFGSFKYVIGGYTYSLSSIQNGILRGNQRPPYNLMKPFGAGDKRSRVALPYPEPLIHFALVSGTRSGPALRCYSARNIDGELMEAARQFLRNGGLTVYLNAKVAYASMILKWFSVDFGNEEVEVLKHVSNYLNPADSTVLLDLLATSELKVVLVPENANNGADTLKGNSIPTMNLNMERHKPRGSHMKKAREEEGVGLKANLPSWKISASKPSHPTSSKKNLGRAAEPILKVFFLTPKKVKKTIMENPMGLCSPSSHTKGIRKIILTKNSKEMVSLINDYSSSECKGCIC